VNQEERCLIRHLEKGDAVVIRRVMQTKSLVHALIEVEQALACIHEDLGSDLKLQMVEVESVAGYYFRRVV
jgi:hypothetical protein